jgi:hypothetical protein
MAAPPSQELEPPANPGRFIPVRCGALLETASHLTAIQCSHLHRADTGLIDIVDDHTGDALVDHLLDRAGAIGKHRGSATLGHDTRAI